jgi:acetyltransferase-like isoleucine patch superfamily enzyme
MVKGIGTYIVGGNVNILYPLGGANLVIGKYCSISTGLTVLLGGEHRAEWISPYPFPEFVPQHCTGERHWRINNNNGGVVIGNDVWIGHGVTILSGVTIGDGAVIGTLSVVAKDIPPYSVAVGNPCKVVKQRFSEEHIKRLLEIKWWDLPPEKINSLIPLLMSEKIDDFIEAI